MLQTNFVRHGPAAGYSALYEAVRGEVEIVPCFTFGNIDKQMYAGPATATLECQPFVPLPKVRPISLPLPKSRLARRTVTLQDISDVNLPSPALELHNKLAENMHELWAMHKIENGWIWGPERDEDCRTHPCIAPYADIPQAEKDYNINLALDSIKSSLPPPFPSHLNVRSGAGRSTQWATT